MKIKLTFTETLLGSTPKSNIYEQWIGGRAPDEETSAEEAETAPDLTRGVTGFHYTAADCQPFLYDYIVKGFFKEACGLLRLAPESLSAKLAAHKKKIGGLIVVRPRQIVLVPVSPIWMFSRPLRANTAQGERVAIATSEAMAAGSTAEFEIHIIGGLTEAHVLEWLDFGAVHGLGQWRNAGYGTFSYEVV